MPIVMFRPNAGLLADPFWAVVAEVPALLITALKPDGGGAGGGAGGDGGLGGVGGDGGLGGGGFVPEVLNVAVTDCAALIVTVQVPVPLHAPPQPAKLEPEVAEAVSVTLVPCVKLAVQVVPQLIPAGLELTVPAPLPFLVTLRPKLPAGSAA